MGSARSPCVVLLANCLLTIAVSLASCGFAERNNYEGHRLHNSMFVARRTADNSRPISRGSTYQPETMSASQESPAIVMGKFKAPAPDNIYRQRIPKSSNFGEQTMSASYRVADSDQLEKVVNGVIGASSQLDKRTSPQQQQQQRAPRERTVSAKIQVSDEGLNYPPSKLSADIHGNVAEIVTAPPEAVDSDFLEPQVSQLFGKRHP